MKRRRSTRSAGTYDCTSWAGSSTFAPASTLPEWMQGWVAINPVTHIISAARELCNYGTFGTDGWLAIAGALVVIAIFAPLAVRKYRTHT